MFCQNCGFKNEDSVKFCANCGSIIDNLQSSDDNNIITDTINNSLDNYNIKDKYIFIKGRYINCNSIVEVKMEENNILIMTSKTIYYLKYEYDYKALDDYTKFISFIADDVFEFKNYKE